MPRNPNSAFEVALQHAKTRLQDALQARADAVIVVQAMDVEIPKLEQTIKALEGWYPREITPSPEPTMALYERGVTGEHRAVETSAGNLSEDELLPEPEGTPLTEE